MFIQTEATPNPATLKFLPGKPVLPGGTRDYRDAEAATESPLAQKLFSVSGVAGVLHRGRLTYDLTNFCNRHANRAEQLLKKAGWKGSLFDGGKSSGGGAESQ